MLTHYLPCSQCCSRGEPLPDHLQTSKKFNIPQMQLANPSPTGIQFQIPQMKLSKPPLAILTYIRYQQIEWMFDLKLK